MVFIVSIYIFIAIVADAPAPVPAPAVIANHLVNAAVPLPIVAVAEKVIDAPYPAALPFVTHYGDPVVPIQLLYWSTNRILPREIVYIQSIL